MKILMVADHPGWAFDHIANDLSALDIEGILFETNYYDKVTPADQARFDLIYPMSVSIAERLYKAGIPLERMATGITSLVPYEPYLANKSLPRGFMQFIRRLRGVNTYSDEIVRLFNPYFPLYKTRVGIDTARFKPASGSRDSLFRVGWVGRIDLPARRELKGYDMVRSALSGLRVDLDIRTFKEHYVPREQMIEYYQGLDCLICSSRTESIPFPVLEAASCGVPIISTEVGIVPELIRNKHNGIIIPRTANAIRKEVMKLMMEPGECRKMGENARNTIVDQWSWNICKRDWEGFFKSLHV
ncbi:glycosyltransferase family 4 protein [Paenibacillus lycopersici]|uniref:Glycosyltransferase family 4 protein n=1 Tax=Paenibacillus lycopersici TaxID=2704462 RepID=A0A6C0G2K7_9BACL|nr:glycosyltransferase family 4 protein [Paenibacillus lycopersici]QHT62173.1 glycosyltransferase family 4 protein [Paenibacillus lycopersici]